MGTKSILAQTATAFATSLLAVTAAAVTAAPAATQERSAGAGRDGCALGVVSSLVIDNRPVFDPSELAEGSALRPLFSFANALHVTTRPSFIRRELLFAEGDCYDPEILAESGRVLRAYGFFDDATLTARELEEGSWEVAVLTRDQWTTKFDLGVAFDQGLQLERLQLAEENLLGRGLLAQVFMRRRREQRDLGFGVRDPRLLGTRADAALGLGRSRVGRFLDAGITYPFVSEAGKWAFRSTVSGRDEVFAYSTGTLAGATHVLLPLRVSAGELSLARRFGEPGSLVAFGVGVSHDELVRSAYEGGVEVVTDSEFGDAASAPDSVAAAVRGRLVPYAVTRVNLMVSSRNLRFERATGLDALRGEQDVALGLDVGATLGRSVGAWPSGEPSADDTFLRFGLASGWKLGGSYFFFDARAQGRRVEAASDTAAWRDLLGELDLLAYLRAPVSTFLLRASASGGRGHHVPFQLTLGGREGLRGLREEAFPGSDRLLFSAESRIAFDLTDFIDTGITLFADAGRMWGGDVPYGTDSDWRTSVGAGIRLGFPAGTPRVARIDVAFPLGVGGASPVLRITMREFLGIAWGTQDTQTERSRLSRVGPDRFQPGEA